MRSLVDERYLDATGTAVAIAHALGGKSGDVLKKYRRSLERMHGVRDGKSSDPVSELRRRLGAIVPVIDRRSREGEKK